MSWFRSKTRAPARLPHARPLDAGAALAVSFACSACGRTDLPAAGDWDPPVCQECDATLAEDEIYEEVDLDAG